MVGMPSASFALCVSFFVLHEAKTTLALPSDREASTFVENLISSSTAHPCSTIYIRQDDVHFTEALVSKGMEKTDTSVPGFTVNFLKDVRLNFSLEEAGQINRRMSNCKIAVAFVGGNYNEMFDRLQKALLPNPAFLPFIHTDFDHWIFLAENGKLVDKLLTSPFPSRIKYKLGIQVNFQDDLAVSAKSVSFFGGDAGSPLILEIPHRQSNFDQYFPDFVSNLNGKVLNVAAASETVWIEVDRNNLNGVNNALRGKWKRFIVEFLVVKFNFTYHLLRSGGTGKQLPNGTWTGTIGDITSGRADFIAKTGITPNRMKAASFSSTFMDVCAMIFIASYGQPEYSSLALVGSFDGVMWGCIISCTIVTFIIFHYLMTYMSNIGVNSDMSTRLIHGHLLKKRWGVRQQIFFVARSYLNQDCPMPSSAPLECFAVMWLFYTLVITTVYRAKLVSLLAYPNYEPIPTNFEELSASSYELGYVKHGDFLQNMLRASKNVVYSSIYQRMTVFAADEDRLNCIWHSLQKNYACISWDFQAAYLIAKNFTDAESRKLFITSDKNFPSFQGPVFAPGSIYKEDFEYWTGWTRPFFLSDIWQQKDIYDDVKVPKRKWWKETNQTELLLHNDFHHQRNTLHFENIKGIFYIWTFCLVVSAVVFQLEKIYHILLRWKERVKRPKEDQKIKERKPVGKWLLIKPLVLIMAKCKSLGDLSLKI